MPRTPDVLIAGAGVIGLSLALELRSRGLRVVVSDQDSPMAQASQAAAGMLAVDDPHNPKELQALSQLSRSLYGGFLDRITALSGLPVPFQTSVTLQTMPDGSRRALPEHSIDPRQLAPALITAVGRAGVCLHHPSRIDPHQRTSALPAVSPGAIVFATGAWPCGTVPVTPRKGQMLQVRIPSGMALQEVHRAEHIYVVPRTQGPQAGTALIGATVEDAGFETTTHPADLDRLRRLGAALVAALGNRTLAPQLEAWAGLRPATPDGLPILGRSVLEPRSPHPMPPTFVATGHFRNGILLAPATAVVLADLMENRAPAVNLDAFSPARFAPAPAGG